ncbi:MAG TPA: 2Fe-2S iron-sulfur cluster-binding protein, partial [Sphingomonadales bacterium]|nr:2Fe-2S iron-sulfur cluster-binding protein [Sphingomonadales bacterium]
MPTLKINGKDVTVAAGSTVMQACEAAGIEIPHFCYHRKLEIAGNCRMCLVEMEKSPKPIASCAMPAGEGMVIRTDTPTVKRAREGVMEFLLINHPLDCPICDQAGECKLQEYSVEFGQSASAFAEPKVRKPKQVDLGPRILLD